MHFPDTQKALLTHPGLGLRTSLTPSLRTYSPFLLTVKGSLGPSLSAAQAAGARGRCDSFALGP